MHTYFYLYLVNVDIYFGQLVWLLYINHVQVRTSKYDCPFLLYLLNIHELTVTNLYRTQQFGSVGCWSFCLCNWHQNIYLVCQCSRSENVSRKEKQLFQKIFIWIEHTLQFFLLSCILLLLLMLQKKLWQFDVFVEWSAVDWL